MYFKPCNDVHSRYSRILLPQFKSQPGINFPEFLAQAIRLPETISGVGWILLFNFDRNIIAILSQHTFIHGTRFEHWIKRQELLIDWIGLMQCSILLQIMSCARLYSVFLYWNQSYNENKDIKMGTINI